MRIEECCHAMLRTSGDSTNKYKGQSESRNIFNISLNSYTFFLFLVFCEHHRKSIMIGSHRHKQELMRWKIDRIEYRYANSIPQSAHKFINSCWKSFFLPYLQRHLESNELWNLHKSWWQDQSRTSCDSLLWIAICSVSCDVTFLCKLFTFFCF